MSVLSWAETHISAAHHPKGRQQLHGHTWRVRAWWRYDGSDAVELRKALMEACAPLDHALLPDNLTRAEEIAEHLGHSLRADRVDVWRDAEQMGATWTP